MSSSHLNQITSHRKQSQVNYLLDFGKGRIFQGKRGDVSGKEVFLVSPIIHLSQNGNNSRPFCRESNSKKGNLF